MATRMESEMETGMLTVQGNRLIVLLNAIQPWPTKKIAFFQSTNTSNSSIMTKDLPPGTFYPIFKMCEETNPANKLEVKGYLKKMKIESLIPEGKFLHQWMLDLLILYFNDSYISLGLPLSAAPPWNSWESQYTSFKKEELINLLSLFREIQVIHYLLINYFFYPWQLCISIKLGQQTSSGYWNQNLKFSSFVLEHSCNPEYTLPAQKPPIILKNDDECISWLKSNDAQTSDDMIILTSKAIKLQPSDYDSLLKSASKVEMRLSLVSKLDASAARAAAARAAKPSQEAGKRLRYKKTQQRKQIKRRKQTKRR